MSRGRGDGARWGLLATSLVLGATLIATTWSSHRGIVAVSSQLARVHGEDLVQGLRQSLAPGPGHPSNQQLASLLDQFRDQGLVHLAILDREGRPRATAGTPSAPFAPSQRPDPEGDHGWRRLGDRYQLVAPLNRPGGRGPGGPRPQDRPPRPPRDPDDPDRPRDDRPRKDRSRDDRPRDDRPRDERPRDGRERDERDRDGRDRDDRPRDGRHRPPKHLLALEFEASTARSLRQQTAGALALGSASALLLMLASVVFWRLSRERERARRQLEHQQRLSALGEMSAVLAHEIRNPLASLKGTAQLLAEQIPETHTEGRKVHRIVREATRLEKLTNDLLDFARTGHLERQAVDPAELVESCRQELVDDRLRVDTRAAPDVWPLDRVRLRQVLTNLLRNALQASPPDAPVDLVVDVVDQSSDRAGSLRLRIRDRGDGLPKGHEEEIFQPFFTTRAQGVGLGLAVARRILQLHGGSLTARNHPEGGAELEARIPANPTSQPEEP